MGLRKGWDLRTGCSGGLRLCACKTPPEPLRAKHKPSGRAHCPCSCLLPLTPSAAPAPAPPAQQPPAHAAHTTAIGHAVTTWGPEASAWA